MEKRQMDLFFLPDDAEYFTFHELDRDIDIHNDIHVDLFSSNDDIDHDRYIDYDFDETAKADSDSSVVAADPDPELETDQAKTTVETTEDKADSPQQTSTAESEGAPGSGFDPADWQLPTPLSLSVTTDTLKSRVETQIRAVLTFSSTPHTHIHLPPSVIAKQRQQRKSYSCDPNTLELDAVVVCDHDRSKCINVCPACLTRERKRASRKKLPSADDTLWLDSDSRGLMFNCLEVMELEPNPDDTKHVDIPLRIPCYCRHHSEKLGFRVYFVVRDHTGLVLARAFTQPIMITDDHKTMKKKMSDTSDSENPRKRKPTQSTYRVYDESNFNTRSHTVESFGFPAYSSSVPLTIAPPALSPSATPAVTPSVTRAVTPSVAPSAVHNIPSPVMSPVSSVESRASTPESSVSSRNASGPTLHRLIPTEGPIRGGIEVTLLGTCFHQGLTVMFGDRPAVKTHIWNESTIVAVLPPAAAPGPVVVRLRTISEITNDNLKVFTYIDDTDRQLMELALQVIGLKMTGRLEDARQIAMRIVSHTGNSDPIAATTAANLELTLLKCLDLVDYDDSPHKVQWQLQNGAGQTMLHLSCVLGFQRLTAALLARGASCRLKDKSGYTPLHHAVLRHHREIAQRLRNAGAEPVRSYSDEYWPTSSGPSSPLSSDSEADPPVAIPRNAIPRKVVAPPDHTKTKQIQLKLTEYIAQLQHQTNWHAANHFMHDAFSSFKPVLANKSKRANKLMQAAFDHTWIAEYFKSDPPSYEEIYPDGHEVMVDDKKRQQEILLKFWQTKKKKIRNDLMLFAFWLPVMCLVLAYAGLSFAGYSMREIMSSVSVKA